MASIITRSQSTRAPLGCWETGDLHHGFTDKTLAAAASCYRVNMDQKLRIVSNTLLSGVSFEGKWGPAQYNQGATNEIASESI